MIKTIVTGNHKSLRTVSKPAAYDDAALEVVHDLLDTLHDTGELGVGLSANQIDASLRIFVAKIGQDAQTATVFINPEIVETAQRSTADVDPDKRFLEGCLSLPNIYAFVERSAEVVMRYHTLLTLEQGNAPVKQTFVDDDAVVVQHELDHLDGILFTDHAITQGQTIYEIVEGEEPRIINLE